MRTLIAVCAVLCLSNAVRADDHADFRMLAWLEGCWSGEGLGGVITECWMSSPDGNMVGTFQIVEDGQLQFFEALLLGEVDGVAGYHVKHYDADFGPWEAADEVVSFAFVSSRGTQAEFEGLTYDMDSDGVLHVELSFANGGVARFDLRRVD